MDEQNISIHLLTPEDAAGFHSLRLQALLATPAAFSMTYEEAAAESIADVVKFLQPKAPLHEQFVLGAFTSAGTMIGSTNFSRGGLAKIRHKGLLWGMYVDPEYRGWGIGKALLQQAIARANALAGLEQVNLMVETSNATAHHLYLSLGFTIYGRESKCLKQGETYWDANLMALQLTPLPATPHALLRERA